MNERIIKKILLVCGIVFMLLFFLIPFAWMVLISLSSLPDFLTTGEFHFTLNNYVDILTQENLHFVDYLKNSLIVATISAIICVIIAAFSAYATSRFKFRGKMLIVLAVLTTSMFPQISIIGYLYKLFANLRLINTYVNLILPYIALNLPLGLWILVSYFSQIPKEIDEAALVDGAGRLQILFRVILPLAMPGLLATGLLLFVFSFNEFLFALMLTTDFHAQTVPVGIALFEGLHGQIPWGYIMAASVFSSIPVIIIALFFQKYIVQGLTRGAIK